MPHRKPPYLLFLLLLGLDASALLMEKFGVNEAGGAGGGVGPFFAALLRRPWVWLSLAMGPAQLWVWTRILARTDLSLAYPLSSLNVPVTLLASHLLLREQLPWQVWLGAALITLGSAIVGGSAHGEPPTKAEEEELATNGTN